MRRSAQTLLGSTAKAPRGAARLGTAQLMASPALAAKLQAQRQQEAAAREAQLASLVERTRESVQRLARSFPEASARHKLPEYSIPIQRIVCPSGLKRPHSLRSVGSSTG